MRCFFLIFQETGGRYGALLPLLRLIGFSPLAISFSVVGPVQADASAFASALPVLRTADLRLSVALSQTPQRAHRAPQKEARHHLAPVPLLMRDCENARTARSGYCGTDLVRGNAIGS